MSTKRSISVSASSDDEIACAHAGDVADVVASCDGEDHFAPYLTNEETTGSFFAAPIGAEYLNALDAPDSLSCVNSDNAIDSVAIRSTGGSGLPIANHRCVSRPHRRRRFASASSCCGVAGFWMCAHAQRVSGGPSLDSLVRDADHVHVDLSISKAEKADPNLFIRPISLPRGFGVRMCFRAFWLLPWSHSVLGSSLNFRKSGVIISLLHSEANPFSSGPCSSVRRLYFVL